MTTWSRAGLGAAVVAVTMIATGCDTTPSAPMPTSVPTASAPGTHNQPSDARVIAMGLAAPWSITFYDTTALVSERDSGRIIEVIADGSTRTAGVIRGVATGGEGGLLGIAAHRRYLYAYYTAETDNRIVRIPIGGPPGALRLGKPETVLAGIPAAAYHNGGRIAFGPDGMLYATTGDAGQPARAQDPTSLAGKILRVTPDGDVPADNPFPGSPVYSANNTDGRGTPGAGDDRIIRVNVTADGG